MGQRLNIEIMYEGKCIANSYYHWSGYTSCALRFALDIIGEIKERKETDEWKQYTPLQQAFLLLYGTGSRVTEDEKKFIEGFVKELEGFDLTIAKSRNSGLLAVSEEGMEETRRWEEGRLEIYLDDENAYTDLFFITDAKEYLKEYEIDEEDAEKIQVADFILYDDYWGVLSFDDFVSNACIALEHIENRNYHFYEDEKKERIISLFE